MNANPLSLSADLPARLLAARSSQGHWEGELSSSALSTATALFSLKLYVRHSNANHLIKPVETLNRLIQGGIDWLLKTQNPDGGWGDTIRSVSNISTTALCWAALTDATDETVRIPLVNAEAWLTRTAGSVEPEILARAIGDRYGKDRTFSVPILTLCALAGRLGTGKTAWRYIPQLPFELAACPHQWFQIIRLPVVSYALPALIAMGHVRHFHRPTWNPITRLLRWVTGPRTLRVLQSIQPEGGGFLEATPLTSFVTMSLIGAGHIAHPVVQNGIDFVLRSVRPDGSWPIDTNLATWVTTLSINALARHPDFPASLPTQDSQHLRDWLLGQQYKMVHPYTHAAPGGWAWTDLPGGVPDADDTAGALIALWHLGFRDPPVIEAVSLGTTWLLNLQNRDGGVPTFCRGWGALPFDRSGSDLTAHALHAWAIWKDLISPELAARVKAATIAALEYLAKQQRSNGSWAPLWFGSEAGENEQNFTYGTSRVLSALSTLLPDAGASAMMPRAIDWLTLAQNPDGSWGGDTQTPGSVEETSLALQALSTCSPEQTTAIKNGLAYLDQARLTHSDFEPTPIGFYFAKLWYFEKLYPLIYATGTAATLKSRHSDPLAPVLRGEGTG